MWRRLLKALVPEDAATTPLLLQAASVHDRVVPVLLQVGATRCKASSTVAVPPSIHTVPPSTHCKHLPMPSWPVAFAALPDGRGAVAAEAQSQLPEPISQSARRLPRGLFRGACRSRPLRPLLFVAVGGSRPSALQTISAHPADVQIVEDFLGILKWQWHKQTQANPHTRASSLTL